MKTGRNDPCPCGSGKKYKRCCLAKQQEAERAHRAAEQISIAPVSPSKPASLTPQPELTALSASAAPDPTTGAFNARWEAFDAANYEGKIAFFYQTLDEEELMDAEMAFEMLDRLYVDSIERDERDRFEKLLAALRERLPDVYAEESHYFLQWQIDNALASGRMTTLPALVREFSNRAGKQVDLFFKLLDQLAYHGQLSLLLEAVTIAWPLIKDSSDVLPWAIEEFADQAADYVIFDFLEKYPSPTADDPELIVRLENYIDVNPERLARYLSYLIQSSERTWIHKDFDSSNKQHRQNLADLGLEFLAYLKQVEHVPYTKGKLAREQLLEYFLKRQDGELGSRQRTSKTWHPLCPDHASLDRFLGGLLNFINPQHHKVVATFELMPAWLRFLLSRQLITTELLEETLHELKPLHLSLLEFYSKYNGDPALRCALEVDPLVKTIFRRN